MKQQHETAEFWENAFEEKREMWGFEAAQSAQLSCQLFLEKGLKSILIPGFGYGRNAQIFLDAGMSVTGIEISKTAIELYKKQDTADLTIYQGSVTDMPFDNQTYDGIFCYALIHLFDAAERQKLISDCYNQLADGGYMIFSGISTAAPSFGQGTQISENRYEIFPGVKMYFYTREQIEKEFSNYGLVDIREVQESQPFYLIRCEKIKK